MMNDFPPLDDNSTAEIQTQPNSREAEEAVLGSVLIYPESYLEVAQILQQDDFYIIPQPVDLGDFYAAARNAVTN